MQRSFRLRVFLAVGLCVVAFSGASRLLVANSALEPLHGHFSEVLARHAARELRAAPGPVNTEKIKGYLEKSVDELRPGEMLVWADKDPATTGAAQALALALTAATPVWTPLDGQSTGQPFEMADLKTDMQDWRILRTPYPQGKLYVAIQKNVLTRNAQGILQTRDGILRNLWPMLLVFVVLVTIVLSRAALKPVQTLQNAFSIIDIKNPTEHISPTHHYREFARFIGYFNALIDRLRGSYALAARFSSDAAHELRTPLTIIRGYLHRLVNQAPDGSQLQIQLSLVAEEVERLISISNKLLVLSQADAGRVSLDMQSIKLNDMVGEMVDDLRAQHRELTFSIDMPSGVTFVADQELIWQITSNLFGNAVKYNRPQGQVKFKARLSDKSLVFSLSNTTHLSTAGLDDRIFERFYRYRETDKQEFSQVAGSGLGLSLCREIVTAHGGTLRLKVEDDSWVTLECTLPCGN